MTGDPHTDADCDQHARPRRAAPAGAGDPLTLVEPLPLAVRRQYPDDDAAVRDVRSRLQVARDWRGAAEEVAGGRAETEATWAFLATQGVLGLPVPGVPGAVVALWPGMPTDTGTVTGLLAAAVGKLGATAAGQEYQNRACLVPGPVTKRLPSSTGGVELVSGQPVRMLRLPMGERPLSRRGRGILLLFEARYTMGVHFVPGPSKPPGYWEAEAALHIFEFDLLRSLGGGYQDAVAASLDELRRTGDLLDRPRKVLSRRRRRALAEPFGALDDEELHLWASVAYRNAIFIALGSLEAFAGFLRSQAT